MYTQIAPDVMRSALSSLALIHNGITLYSAGLPNFPSNFTRDSILSAILLQDPTMLHDQLVFCAATQGREKNRYSGEEPGKIFHEMPPAKVRGLSTEFNACDTTALFIIGHEKYLRMTEDVAFITRQRKYLEKAVTYILSHLVNNLFIEDPKLSGADHFALRVTYWKDSLIHSRESGVPAYPAVFTLAHVQNMCALRSAAFLLDAPDLAERAALMLKYMWILYNDSLHTFHIGLDQRGFFTGTSSDALHLLYYLEPDDIPLQKVEALVSSMSVLETTHGYRTMDEAEKYIDSLEVQEEEYNARTVWPFEQAFIHMAAKKFGLFHVMEVSERIATYLDTFTELFVIDESGFRKDGSKNQLWTIAAKAYFDRVIK